MKIFNMTQANYLIEKGCLVIGCALGNNCKVYIEFKEDYIFIKYLEIWNKRKRLKFIKK